MRSDVVDEDESCKNFSFKKLRTLWMTLLFVALLDGGGDKDGDGNCDGDGDVDAGDAFPDVAAYQKCRQENLFSLFHIFHSAHTWRSRSELRASTHVS